jgi:hypothetical protein
MLAPTRWPFAAHCPRMPRIGRRGHACGLVFLTGRGLAALRREFWPSDQDLDTWLTDHAPFP